MKMKTSEKLIEMLSGEGFEAEFLEGVEGVWRKADVHRWSGLGLDRMREPPRRLEVFSWDTMTDCVRNGFTVSREDVNATEVSANPKQPS